MKMPVAILLTLLALLLNAAADVRADFNTANNLYAQGKFSEAAEAYEAIIAAGPGNTALYFNLGSAYFKSGQIGRAIAAFRQAERRSPRDPDVRANLQFARNHVSGNDSVRGSAWQRALGRLTLNEWTLLFAAALWIWLILLALREWKPGLRGRLAKSAMSAGLLTLLLGGCTAGDWVANHSTRIAVVLVKDAAVKTGPLDDSQNSYTPKDGTELTVIDERDQWLQVSDGHQRIGWIRRTAAQVL